VLRVGDERDAHAVGQVLLVLERVLHREHVVLLVRVRVRVRVRARARVRVRVRVRVRSNPHPNPNPNPNLAPQHERGRRHGLDQLGVDLLLVAVRAGVRGKG